MGKKVIALGLALVLLCGMLAGCGAQKKETAAASGGNVIKVGFAGPLSGASGQVGASCYNGALMAFNERKAELEEKSGCTSGCKGCDAEGRSDPRGTEEGV